MVVLAARHGNSCGGYVETVSYRTQAKSGPWCGLTRHASFGGVCGATVCVVSASASGSQPATRRLSQVRHHPTRLPSTQWSTKNCSTSIQAALRDTN